MSQQQPPDADKVWGFDFTNDQPSTAITSDFEWNQVSADSIPEFYSRPVHKRPNLNRSDSQPQSTSETDAVEPRFKKKLDFTSSGPQRDGKPSATDGNLQPRNHTKAEPNQRQTTTRTRIKNYQQHNRRSFDSIIEINQCNVPSSDSRNQRSLSV